MLETGTPSLLPTHYWPKWHAQDSVHSGTERKVRPPTPTHTQAHTALHSGHTTHWERD